MRRTCLAALATLAACGTPQEQCISRATREVRTLDTLIAETQGNLDRGYAIEQITVWDEVWEWCPTPPPAPVAEGEAPPPPPKPALCRDEVARTVDRPKTIDLALEARKLSQLQDKRRAVARASEPLVAQCRVEYPE